MATGHLRMGYRQLLPSLRPPFDALPRWLTHLSTDHLPPPPTTLSSVTFRGLLVDLPGAGGGGGDGWQMGACERAGGCVFLAGFVQKKNQNHQNWKSLACFKGQKIIHHFTLVNRKPTGFRPACSAGTTFWLDPQGGSIGISTTLET